MDKTLNIMDAWPFPYAPRPNQVTALEWMAEQDVKYLLLEAPVGAGKSNIGVTYSRYLENATFHWAKARKTQRGSSFILTPQRILQEQYEKSFRDVDGVQLASLYGKSNYTCRQKNATCDIGGLVKPQCDYCPHRAAKERAKASADVVLNYKLALTSWAFTLVFKPRKLMVLDECHTLENHLIDFDALSIAEWRCKKYHMAFKLCKTLDSALTWMTDAYLPDITDALEHLRDRVEPLMDMDGSSITRSDLQLLREYSRLHDHVDEVTMMSLRTPKYLEENYVLVWDKVRFQFKRLKGADAFHKIVVPFADRFLFMSSTILNKDGFCEDLGIPEKQTAFLSLTSEFPAENRPVVYMPQCRMNAKWKNDDNETGRERMLRTMTKLLKETHKHERGLVHTGNFEIAKWLVENLEGEVPHHIYHHNPESGDDRNSVIEAFQQDPKPSVLISPSSTEGLDLKDGLGRFAIFVKVGFPYLGDQWIKRRMELSKEWYFRRTLINMIQGSGRIVRSKDDFGTTYILDTSFTYLRKNVHYMMPKWWKESIQNI